MPRVSIITALYNHERFVAQAIESVLAQTYGDWEHLIWDDGSTDKSLEIARRYAEKNPDRVKVFSHAGGGNRGQEHSRNAALERASGELLCLLDSDDYYLPQKLSLLVPCFDDARVGLAYGRAEFVSEEGARATPLAVSGEPSGRVLDQLLLDNFVCAGATLFRRRCLEKGLKFDAEFKTIGEYPLWLAIAREWRFAFVPESVAVWRNHGANLGSRLALEAKAELVRLNDRLLADGAFADHRPSLLAARAKRRYDHGAELYSGGLLPEARGRFFEVLTDSEATPELRAKAAALATATLLGAGANRELARAKKRSGPGGIGFD